MSLLKRIEQGQGTSPDQPAGYSCELWRRCVSPILIAGEAGECPECQPPGGFVF